MKRLLSFVLVSSFTLGGYALAQEHSIEPILASELVDRLSKDSAPIILDVRSSKEYDEGHITGAVNIPHSELKERFAELDIKKDQELVVYCQSGRRASIAEDLLKKEGFINIRLLEGHWKDWPNK